MRVLFVETHYLLPDGGRRTSAVDWWRIINPATHLQKNTDWEIEIRKGILSRDDFQFGDPKADLEWELVGRKWDLVWFSYMENPLAYAYLNVISRKFGVKFIIDLDDNILSPDPTHPYFLYQHKKQSDDFHTIVYDAPLLSVTNSYLKKVYKKFRERQQDNIFVLDNYIDPEVYTPKPHIDDNIITIGWFGGSNHYRDLMMTPFAQAIPYILGKYKNVKFELIGFLPKSNFEGLPRFERVEGYPDFYKWVKLWQERTRYWDIGVCPLDDNEFNKCKSSIKTFEIGINKIPVVVSDVRPYKYIQDGKTGYKCRTTKDWIRVLEKLIQDENQRRMLGENIYQEVMKHHTIQNHWQKWRDVASSIVL